MKYQQFAMDRIRWIIVMDKIRWMIVMDKIRWMIRKNGVKIRNNKRTRNKSKISWTINS